MPRAYRVDNAGKWHHVVNRGAAGQPIFMDDQDRRTFLSEIEYAASKSAQIVHCYCLMGNHFHILVESQDGQLSLFPKLLSGRYTRIFNTRHRRDGALFRGRALTVGIADNDHLLRATRYIHVNPVVAGLCQTATEWPWSSAAAYFGDAQEQPWLTTKTIREMVQRDGRREAYAAFISDGIDRATAQFYANVGV